MNKIVVFRGKGEGPVFGMALAHRPLTFARVLHLLPAPRGNRRLVLRATWRRNPGTGRLECRWLAVRDTAADDSAPCRQGTIARRRVGAMRRSLPLFS